MFIRARHTEVDRLVARLSDDISWSLKADVLRQLTAFLAGEEYGPELEYRLHNAVIEATVAAKWEVRKAAALALAEFRYLDQERAVEVLDRLSNDPNRWVGQTASRASRRLRERSQERREWPLTASRTDPTLQYIAAKIRRIGLESVTPARLYDLATDIGEHHYRELAADTAHEINTLLTPLEGYLMKLVSHLEEQGYNDSEMRRYLDASLERLKHLEMLVKDLHTYSSSASGEKLEEVNLKRIVNDAISIGVTHREKKGYDSLVVQHTSVPDELVIEAMPSRLARAVTNLVLNAYQAMPEGGTLEIQAKVIGVNVVELTICDTGKGMTSEEASQAMMRFCTTRGDDGGTGLGLPIAQRIIEIDHHGSLTVESSPGEGTRAIISLPLRYLAERA